MQAGIIDLNNVQSRLDMKKRTELLEQHKYAITEGKDGKWRTYLPDSTREGNRRQIKRTTRQKIEDEVVEYYRKKEKKDTLTLRELYPEWLDFYGAHTTATGTVKRITSDWNKYYKYDAIVDMPIEMLSRVQLDKWAHKKVKDYEMTKTCYYNMSLPIRKMLIYAKEQGYILSNPFEDVIVNAKMFRKKRKADSEEQVYTEQEEVLILEKAWEDYQAHPENTTPLALILVFYLGLRVGEVVALKDTDIVNDHLEIQRMERRNFKSDDGINYSQTGRTVVEHAKTTAGSRQIYLVNSAREVVNQVLTVRRSEGCTKDFYLFTNKGERIKDTAVRWRLEKYCKKAGIRYRSPHKVRKTWISKLIDDDFNINTIREMAGHEDERTTYNNYCFDRKTDKQRREQMEKALEIPKKCDFSANLIHFTPNLGKKVIKGNQNISA